LLKNNFPGVVQRSLYESNTYVIYLIGRAAAAMM